MNLKKVDKMYNNEDVLNSKKELERKNEIMINRLMVLFVVSLTMITFLIMAMNTGIDLSVGQIVELNESGKLIELGLIGPVSLSVILSVIVAGVLFILSVVFFVYNSKKKNSDDKTFNKYNILGFFTILFVFAIAILFLGDSVLPVLLGVTITATLLIFIYCLYQKDFFWFAAATAVGCFLIYYTQSAALNGYFAIAAKILLIALAGILVCLASALKKNKGYLGKKKSVKLVGEDVKYFPAWILCGLFVAVGIISFITVSLALYAMIAVLAYFLAVGIYYTIKLI